MARRRKTGLSKREAQGLVALIAALVLVFVKVVEYSVKAIGWGFQHVANDVKWISEGIRTHQGNWVHFYDQNLHQKVFKYIALICVVPGIVLLADRPIAGLLFIGAASISYFVDKSLFSAIGGRFKEGLVAVLIVSGLLSDGFYRKAEIERLQKQQAEQKRRAQQEIAIQRKQAALLDSSNKLASLGKAAFLTGRYKRANALYDQALAISPTNDDALYLKGFYYKETKQTDKAILMFAQISPSSIKYEDALIEQGQCLIKKGARAQAVALFKQASNLHNYRGEKLYNKYNPLRKRIIGYITRCCDGSSSGAKGRGACSHHGGVCNWNDPIYSGYRQYE